MTLGDLAEAVPSRSRFIGDAPPPSPPPSQPHHLDIDLVVLVGLLTAQPDQYLRTVCGLTGAEELLAAEIIWRHGTRALRLVFDRAITEPMFSTTAVPPLERT